MAPQINVFQISLKIWIQSQVVIKEHIQSRPVSFRGCHSVCYFKHYYSPVVQILPKSSKIPPWSFVFQVSPDTQAKNKWPGIIPLLPLRITNYRNDGRKYTQGETRNCFIVQVNWGSERQPFPVIWGIVVGVMPNTIKTRLYFNLWASQWCHLIKNTILISPKAFHLQSHSQTLC